jgi:uncharacterized protein YbjT (DUF2867 family)
MSISVIIAGSTGMVGKGVLLECLENPKVKSVLLLNRSEIGITHDKIKELIIEDFNNLSSLREQLEGYDACYFCLGVSSFRMKEKEYNEITYRVTLHLAKLLSDVNPNLSFCYVSGVGTDSSEKGRSMWARVKGKTENALLKLPLKSVYLFRPGYIQPMKGVKSKTAMYNTFYAFLKPFYPLFKWIIPSKVTTNIIIGKAMIYSTLKGSDKTILYNKDINELAAKLDAGIAN